VKMPEPGTVLWKWSIPSYRAYDEGNGEI